jgi:hypothetical protein
MGVPSLSCCAQCAVGDVLRLIARAWWWWCDAHGARGEAHLEAACSVPQTVRINTTRGGKRVREHGRGNQRESRGGGGVASIVAQDDLAEGERHPSLSWNLSAVHLVLLPGWNAVCPLISRRALQVALTYCVVEREAVRSVGGGCRPGVSHRGPHSYLHQDE